MRPLTALKAIRQLGFTAVTLNALYKLGLKTGFFRVTESRKWKAPPSTFHFLFDLPPREHLLATLGAAGLRALLAEADQIVAGQYHQFGGQAVEINLKPSSRRHWTDCEHARHAADIKFTWEPARFGWAFTLGRAFHASGDETYAAAFWRYFETFQKANPPYWGENWMSGQEVGLRLMAFTWAGQVFAPAQATSPEHLAKLAAAIMYHALRIPATLLYARSQNNNHLLTEAAALYTAGLALPQEQNSAQWRQIGQKWLNWCFENQIDASGEYIQHSTNYHRLMLQIALWVSSIKHQTASATLKPNPSPLTPQAHKNLARATHWLLGLLDPVSGQVPNLGANDGAYIFPLTGLPFNDYRPVAQAAARMFLGQNLSPGSWDELSLWLGATGTGKPPISLPIPARHRLDAIHSWGCLRSVRYQSRPSHADQLHFDLWWRGLNIAQDAGTYLYNAAPPWDNRLTSTLVHNTVTVDGREQMTRVSRFLYLDWANAFQTRADNILTAQTDAYIRQDVRHVRQTALVDENHWRVIDDLLNLNHKTRTLRLHWLLPDWEWRIESGEKSVELRLKSPHGWISLNITTNSLINRSGLIRAGELVYGGGLLSPTFGWVSPTYGVKNPALSLAVEVQSPETIRFTTEFYLPTVDAAR